MNKTIWAGITIYNLPQAPAVQGAPATNKILFFCTILLTLTKYYLPVLYMACVKLSHGMGALLNLSGSSRPQDYRMSLKALPWDRDECPLCDQIASPEKKASLSDCLCNTINKIHKTHVLMADVFVPNFRFKYVCRWYRVRRTLYTEVVSRF